MRKKHLVSAEKFKKLYFYKYLFIQIWYGVSGIELLTILYILPKDLMKSLLNSNIVYLLFVPMLISTILWMCSFVLYGDKIAIKHNAYIMKKDENFIFQTVKQTWQQSSRYDCYTYTIKNISNIHKGKYNINVFGDIMMEQCHAFQPKVIIATKQYSHVKIPNIFDDIDLLFE
jgi:hypothetical protein